MTDQTPDTLTALRALVAAVAPLVDPDVVTPYVSAWEFNSGGPELGDAEDVHATLANTFGSAFATLEREKGHPPCDATTTYWPDDEAIDARCVLPVGHWLFTVHRDEDGNDWDEERLTTTGGWGPR
jgi:hypothetical protein